MKRNQPFAQARQMMAAIASIMANNPSHLHPGLIGALGPYKSRGHGKGLYSTARKGPSTAQVKRYAKKARNVARNRAAHR
jgi:hypothetical protein